jgi:Sec-independent protein secretion pathway component TatC
MYDDKHYYVVPIIVLAVFLFVLGYLLGFTLTEKRIYNNCLETNATMIHQDAVAKCRELIK